MTDEITVDSAPEPPQRNLKLWITTGVVGIGFLVLAFVFNSRFGVDPRVVESPLIGSPAPNVELEYLDQGGTLAIGDLKGDIVVVNFFASWCIPNCRDEHPHLRKRPPTTPTAAFTSLALHTTTSQQIHVAFSTPTVGEPTTPMSKTRTPVPVSSSGYSVFPRRSSLIGTAWSRTSSPVP